MTTTELSDFGLSFRKKPVAIQAVRYIGPDAKLLEKSWDVSAEWLFHSAAPIEPTEHWGGACGEFYCAHNYDLYCGTLEDGAEGSAQVRHVVSVGDWIIRGVAGEFYPCRDDIFRATYDFPA